MPDGPEQAQMGRGGVVDKQVGDGLAPALKLPGERIVAGVAQRRPAGAVVPVKAGGVGNGNAAIAVAVKGEVGFQFVAETGVGVSIGIAAVGTAHAGGGVGKGGGVVGLIRGRHDPIAIQVPADSVHLGQLADFNQPVIVAVVVDGGRSSGLGLGRRDGMSAQENQGQSQGQQGKGSGEQGAAGR